ncbi:MAG: radical SAM protein [Anaerolineales bacterium]|nr:radical SAM protein [Anaerolineales bacterium]
MNPLPTILLLSLYELGHQPHGLASPRAHLAQAGLPAHAVDLSVEPFPTEIAARADFVGISVPMHTALRLGVSAARRIRALNPRAKICFYGLYAALNEPYLRETGLADHILAGEYEASLLEWLQPAFTSHESRITHHALHPHPSYLLPLRASLPALSSYAHLLCDDTAYVAGYTETTRGCLHTCTHCPVVPVYGGRFFAIPVETVLADIRQQVEMGAEHITFGDPDFLNGPTHALRIARALHAEFPGLTFDFTTKVEHILQHRALFPEFRALGALFVISAFESLSTETLIRLRKGHTPAELDTALNILHAADLPVQPTFVAFTPWTTLDDYLKMLNWVRTRGVVNYVPVVQYAIRLLIPPKSELLTDPDTARWLGPLDPENFSYTWAHPDPRMDTLYQEISALAERMAEQFADTDPCTAFEAIERVAYALAGQAAPPRLGRAHLLPPPPRLTEDWFC